MPAASSDGQLLKLSLAVDSDLPDLAGRPAVDLHLELRPDATVTDVTTAVARHLGVSAHSDLGLVRTMVSTHTDPSGRGRRRLPPGALFADCGLLDGVRLTLLDTATQPVPDLFIDVEQDPSDLFLIDEQGTHRGRVTRLPYDTAVQIGSAPPGTRAVLVDDPLAATHAATLVNRGAFLECSVVNGANLYLAGERADREVIALLPGGDLAFRDEDSSVLAGFSLTTKAGLHGRSPVGRVQFDVTARLAPPEYAALADRHTRIDAPPERADTPFPGEQIAVPLAMVGALWAVTRSVVALIVTPLAVLMPLFGYLRQKRRTQREFRRRHTDWTSRLQECADELSALIGPEEANARRETPAPEEWALRAYRRLAGLWGRDPGQDEFLRVRLGRGSLPSRYTVKLADGVNPDAPDFSRIMQVRGNRVSAQADFIQPQAHDVPVTVNLREVQLGLVGPTRLVDELATDLMVQIACAHPPGSVGIAALLPESAYARRDYEWMKWLPHTRAGSPLLPAQRFAIGRNACNALLGAVRKLHEEQRDHRGDGPPDSYALLVVHEAAEIDLALLAEVCALGDGLVRVLWLGGAADTAPQLVTSIVELWETGPHDERTAHAAIRSGEAAGQEFHPNRFRTPPLRTVRALAGLYDPRTSGANAGVPQTVPLSALLDIDDVTYPDRPRTSLGTSLTVPLGIGESGVFELDLVQDGPHALIGGTTGSGKSELLQTLAAGLVARYGPHEVNLFLVDFKGGATFAPLRNLPHVAGYVSDLEPRDVNRALAFLRAELRRREKAFEEAGNAKEYRDYLKTATSPLPRLVVMFDEFATMVRDSQETIGAVIDIARRGRSWGVHLILATQQPSRDVVVPQVRANVTARIALKTLSPDESDTVIDRPEAAHIPRSLPGRALIRLETSSLIEFQTGFSGAPYIPREAREPVVVEDFTIPTGPAAHATAEPEDELPAKEVPGNRTDPTTQLDSLIRTITSLGLTPDPGTPKMHDALEAQPTRPAPHRAQPGPTLLHVGIRDLPHLQRQDPLIVDLGKGNWCVVGPNRSGRTTALVTAAEAFLAAPRATRPGLVSLSDDDRLGDELAARATGAVTIPIAQLDAVTRGIDQLWTVLQQRKIRTTAPAADTVDLLLLIDGYDTLARSMATHEFRLWQARLTELLTLGRRHGIHACITARTEQDLERAVAAASTLLRLHAHYDPTATGEHDRLPGFGLDPEDALVQLYQPPPLNEGPAPLHANTDVAAFLDPDAWRSPLGDLTPTAGVLVLGREDISRLPNRIPLADQPVLVVGGPKSGRTTVLLAAAEQLHHAHGKPTALFSPRATLPDPLHAAWSDITADLIKMAKMPDRTARLAHLGDLDVCRLPDGRPILLIDDCFAIAALEDGFAINTLLADLHTQSSIQVVAVSSPAVVGEAPLTRLLKQTGTTVYLKPSSAPSDYDDGQRVRNIALRHRPGITYRPGDAIIQTEQRQVLVHLGSAPTGQQP